MKAAYKDADGRWWRSLGPATDEVRNAPEVQQWHGAAREMWGEVFVPHASPAKRLAKKERDMVVKSAASGLAAASPIAQTYIYRWNRMGRKGQRCRLLTRGAMNSALVEFADGFRAVTSRNALRKVTG